MDFLSPKKKRAHRIRLFVGYGLMGVALAISTLILVFASNGYDIDRKTGDIIQNGLIIIDSKPVSGEIYLNGEVHGQTSERLSVPTGDYKVEIKRDGFRTWQRDVQLEAGSIEQLVYPVLFPQNMVTSSVATIDAPKITPSQSPDRRWLLVPQPGKVANFQLLDLVSDGATSTNLVLPSDVYTAATGTHSFTAIEWSTDNVHVILKHTWGKKSEFIMMDRERVNNSYNLTKSFPDQVINQVALRDKNPNQFYFLNTDKGTLVRAERGRTAITSVATNVLTFKPYQANLVLFASRPVKKGAAVQVRLWDNGQNYALRTLPSSPTYMLDIASFNGQQYVVIGNSADGHAYIYRDPLGELKRNRAPQAIRVLIVPGAQYLSFSAIARFIVLQSGGVFAVYDAETGRQYRYDTKLSLTPGQKAIWMDGHRLSLVSEGKTHVFDFDGTNVQALSAANPAYPPLFDRDYEALFGLISAEKNTKVQLQRTELRLLPQSN